MECNKDEAIRAKGIAEKKMETRDFAGARKIALKAQQLYPDLENISQMIMVCDIHCSSENKTYGNEEDWYGILKIDPKSDEASIKKQFRKFALILHPDKNKFFGADDAFKLIGEAQRVLLDRDKRLLYDSRYKAFGRSVAPSWASQEASKNPNVGKQPPVRNNYMNNVNPRTQQPQNSSVRETFWTACRFCGVRYQYYKEVVNKLLWCQTCKKSFPGIEIKERSAKTQPQVPSQGAFNSGLQSTFEKPGSRTGFPGNVGGEKATIKPLPKKECVSKVGGSKTHEKFVDSSVKTNKEGVSHQSNFLGNMNGKKRKREGDSSKSCFGVEAIPTEKGSNIEQSSPRSSRSRQKVSYNENLNNPLKKSKGGQVFGDSTQQEFEEPLVKEEDKKFASCVDGLQNGEKKAKKVDDYEKLSKADEPSSNSKLSPENMTDSEVYEYPDPDFSDFDKDRRTESFSVGQIWAVYDTLDAMPRFYARIKKVFSPGFKVQITWLEPDPDHGDEIKWMNEGLPVSCGTFEKGNSENTDNLAMFSHLICWEKGQKRDTYKIYPGKGETWALFKNWDMKWYSDSESKKKFEFEFVHVLSDYDQGVGVRIGYLGKVKGYSCLFCRTGSKGNDSFQIPPSELFRFSHRIPSFEMTGEEREDVRKGSFELDPASLPSSIEEINFPEDLNADVGKLNCNGSSSKSVENPVDQLNGFEGNASECLGDEKTGSDSKKKSSDNSSEEYEIPDPEFYDFDTEKSVEKFQIGQIWAVYSDDDGLPKYYCKIKKINTHPKFELYVIWLVVSSFPKDMIKWHDKKMPVSCGNFKPLSGKYKKYTQTLAFSHKLRAELTDKKDIYAIFPRKGEVWALYKDWIPGINHSELEDWEYDMVEILRENESWIEVLALELVDGFKSVFKAQRKEGSSGTMKISRPELLRFSHQIPAFRLTEERGGSLRGFWELDPAALPVTLFCSS